jgi:hypothetical protein
VLARFKARRVPVIALFDVRKCVWSLAERLGSRGFSYVCQDLSAPRPRAHLQLRKARPGRHDNHSSSIAASAHSNTTLTRQIFPFALTNCERLLSHSPLCDRYDDEEAQEIPESRREVGTSVVLLLRARLRRPEDPYLSPESQTLQMRSLRKAVKHCRRYTNPVSTHDMCC